MRYVRFGEVAPFRPAEQQPRPALPIVGYSRVVATVDGAVVVRGRDEIVVWGFFLF